MGRLIERIHHPGDLRALSMQELVGLAGEIREMIIDVVDRNGGHLGSNLGTVELAIALHYVFDFTRERLLWDTGHQAYTHKLLTGRRGEFHRLRTLGGVSGFPSRKESAFDLFDTGHAGTAVSLGLGVSCGDAARGDERKTVVVIGDAAMGNGMPFEAMNHAGALKRNVLIVLNDNRMSISRSVGALSEYLSRIRTKPLYQDLKKDVHEILGRIPVVGRPMEAVLGQVHDAVRHSLVPGLLFQELGFDYFGPVDGHDLEAIIRVLRDVERIQRPVLLHVLTVKGKGFPPASTDPTRYHSLKDFLCEGRGDAEKEGKATYTDVFSDALVELASRDRRIVAVTAAMPDGTGLCRFAEAFPDRTFDVGIAEGHAAAFASGLAYSGLRPVVAVYSTFAQRAFDQLVHDVCLQGSPVVLCLDRAGLVGEDGPTHHGTLDIGFLRAIPGVLLMAPRDGDEMRRMLAFAFSAGRPVVLRYPRESLPEHLPPPGPEIEVGRAEVLLRGRGMALVAYGSMVAAAYEAARALGEEGIDVTVVNARFAKPVDSDLLVSLREDHDVLVTVEDHGLHGGFGSAVAEALADRGVSFRRLERMGIPDRFVTFGPRRVLLHELGLSSEGIAGRVRKLTREGVETPAPSSEAGTLD